MVHGRDTDASRWQQARHAWNGTDPTKPNGDGKTPRPMPWLPRAPPGHGPLPARVPDAAYACIVNVVLDH